LAEAVGGFTLAPRYPRATVSRGARRVAMALGLKAAADERGRIVWLPDAPRLHRGAFVLSPPALAAALAGTGLPAIWNGPGALLQLRGDAPPAPGVLAGPVPRPVPAPAARNGPWRVVVDAGHGGHDSGARGRSGLREKDVTLDLAKRVTALLTRRGASVVLTRDDDRYITLQERVDIARREKADFFVSIHVNSSPNPTARGVESFVYGAEARGRRLADLVRFENADANYVGIIVSDLQQHQYHDASIRMAGSIEKAMVQTLETVGRANRRVKEAPFYVLARASQPSVLIEVGFISNPAEERKLRDDGYRARLAATIAGGVLEVASGDGPLASR
ncbi:MAG: N-acetylmuramoyl-L-alanine amidase, partial [bacterium]